MSPERYDDDGLIRQRPSTLLLQGDDVLHDRNGLGLFFRSFLSVPTLAPTTCELVYILSWPRLIVAGGLFDVRHTGPAGMRIHSTKSLCGLVKPSAVFGVYCGMLARHVGGTRTVHCDPGAR